MWRFLACEETKIRPVIFTAGLWLFNEVKMEQKQTNLLQVFSSGDFLSFSTSFQSPRLSNAIEAGTFLAP